MTPATEIRKKSHNRYLSNAPSWRSAVPSKVAAIRRKPGANARRLICKWPWMWSWTIQHHSPISRNALASAWIRETGKTSSPVVVISKSVNKFIARVELKWLWLG